MKKSISLFLLLALLPSITFAHNAPTTLVSEDVNLLDSIHFGESFLSLKDEAAVTLSELEYAISHQKVLGVNLENTENSRPVIVSREFALYLLLQNMWITLSESDIPAIGEQFSDVHSDSFFAPYIFFAKKVGIIGGYQDGNFRPKHFLSQKELKNIITNAFEKNFDKIQEEYARIQENEENIAFFSAGEENASMWKLSEMYQNIKNVELFDASTLYIENSEADILHHSAGSDDAVLFQKVANLDDYTLYFDYDGTPFLGKNMTKISHEQLGEIMIARINEYRRAYGLSPLKYNSKLDATAQEYAQTLFESRHFEHKDQLGKRVGDRVLEQNYNYIYAVENLAKGKASIDGVMMDWKNSPLHNKNLLNPHVNEAGIGFYGNYWVQVFAKEFPNNVDL